MPSLIIFCAGRLHPTNHKQCKSVFGLVASCSDPMVRDGQSLVSLRRTVVFAPLAFGKKYSTGRDPALFLIGALLCSGIACIFKR